MKKSLCVFANLIFIIIGISTSIFASDLKSTNGFFLKSCKDFKSFRINQSIKSLDQKFQFDSSNCKIVATKSIFPRNNPNGIQFEKGIQLFVYQNKKLKFICLPNPIPSTMICKSWTL